jgi:hypothetical protein
MREYPHFSAWQQKHKIIMSEPIRHETYLDGGAMGKQQFSRQMLNLMLQFFQTVFRSYRATLVGKEHIGK